MFAAAVIFAMSSAFGQVPIGPSGAPAAASATPPTTLQYNIESSFGAACNGTADDAPAFGAASAAIEANSAAQSGTPVVLTIPGGASCTMKSCVVGTSGYPVFYGIPNLTISMVGATMTLASGACASWAGLGIQSSTTTSALFDTVAAGASCVTMATAGQESRFPVGSWVLATAVTLQATGYPPNTQLFEYLQVASRGAGQVCFNSNLVNSYASTYPDYGLNSGGNCGGANCGGPAMLYELYSGWNVSFSIIGGNWNITNGDALYLVGRNINLTSVTMPGTSYQCYAPSESQTITLNNVSIPNCVMLIDKLMTTVNIIGGSLIGQWDAQSSSIVNLNVSRSTISVLNGIAQHTNCNAATITTIAPQLDYGAPLSFNGVNCSLPTIGTGSGNLASEIVNGGGWSVSGGVFTNATSYGPAGWAAPNRRGFFKGLYQYEYSPFTISSMTQTGSNFSIATTLAAGLPTVPVDASGYLYAAPDPYPDWNCSNCMGSADAVDFSQAGAQGAPLFTYSHRIYTCANNIAAVQAANPGAPVIDINNPPAGPTIWGELVSLTVNVSVADTSGNASLPWQLGGKFNNYPTLNSSGAEQNFGPIISLKTAGTRTLTPMTATGAQGGDTLSAPGSVSMTQAIVPYLGTSIGGDAASTCPVATITWETAR